MRLGVSRCWEHRWQWMSVVCIVVESMSIHVMMNWHIKLRGLVKEKAIAYLRDREDKAETTDPVPWLDTVYW